MTDTITLPRAVVEQALEALEFHIALKHPQQRYYRDSAIYALRDALAREEQEPVAWRYKKAGGGWFVSDNEPQYVEQWDDIEGIQPLYTAPQRREWVGLTEEERRHCTQSPFTQENYRAIEAALKEKNT